MSVITISGNTGSGAIDIGQRVAKALKFDYMDRDILLESATALGVSMDTMAHRDERTLGFRERLAEMFRDFLERSAMAGAADPMMGSSGLEVLMATSYSEAAALPPREVSEFSEDRYKEAITTLRRAVDLRPVEPTAYYQLGLAYYRSGQAELAKEMMDRMQYVKSQFMVP